jgi:hypothetical protein
VRQHGETGRGGFAPLPERNSFCNSANADDGRPVRETGMMRTGVAEDNSEGFYAL